jgi:hypothetical protein
MRWCLTRVGNGAAARAEVGLANNSEQDTTVRDHNDSEWEEKCDARDENLIEKERYFVESACAKRGVEFYVQTLLVPLVLRVHFQAKQEYLKKWKRKYF